MAAARTAFNECCLIDRGMRFWLACTAAGAGHMDQAPQDDGESRSERTGKLARDGQGLIRETDCD